MMYEIKTPWELREITIHGQVTIGCYETFDKAVAAKANHDKVHFTASVIYDSRTGEPQLPASKAGIYSAKMLRTYGYMPEGKGKIQDKREHTPRKKGI